MDKHKAEQTRPNNRPTTTADDIIANVIRDVKQAYYLMRNKSRNEGGDASENSGEKQSRRSFVRSESRVRRIPFSLFSGGIIGFPKLNFAAPEDSLR